MGLKSKKTEVSKEKMEKTLLEQDLEAEAQVLEAHALENTDDMPAWDSQEGLADLMARMARGERAEAPGADELDAEDLDGLAVEAVEVADADTDVAEASVVATPVRRVKKIRWKIVAAFAAVLVLALGMSVGTIGEKVYTPEAVTELKDGEVIIKINNEERIEREVEEEEIYAEIEDRLGILALRLGYKPAGMELYYVEIIDELGEARIHYLYQKQVIYIYMSRNYSNTDISIKSEGEDVVVETVNSFWFDKELEIFEIRDEQEKKTYLIEFEKENVAYAITGAIELDELKKIIEEIYIKNA